MKHWLYKRNLSHYINTLIVIILSIIFYKFMDNMNGVYYSISVKIATIVNVLKPFLLGVIIAYILNPIIKWFEVDILTRFKTNKQNKYERIISTIFVFILFICIIALTLVLVVPRIAMNIRDLLSSLPTFIYINENKIIDWIHDLYKNDVYNIAGTIEKNINDLFYNTSRIFQRSLNNLLLSIIAFTSKTLNILLALIVSFYISIDKDSLLKGIERLLRALFEDKYVDSFKKFCKEADNTFVKFVIGKSIDSFIIGLIAFIGLSFMKSPYSLLISMIVGVTNMIPYFGPLIGEAIGFIFVSFYSPIKALKVLLFLFILQQFDSFYLTPKILGDKMEVGPIWIIFSIVLGGSLFGVIGMFLGVPAISIIIVAVRKFINKRLEEKKNRIESIK
ncbi:AI-2E family transporter [Crassaminicella thermophila]|uniref:AI-2E family transporter n=1 Tax=Crassaminicella thermophila TaxID=2599308 RepID=A0A5C0SBB5_CRATE|nr:AI-2E family transporter [Crassaminicella thermophila]QEK11207.1 AI-2E family transporter [Crassaminicella thermophila]